MNDNKLHFYDDGIERMIIGDPFGPTQVPSTKLHIKDDGKTQYPGSQCPGIGLHVGPKTPIHIIIGRDEFTDIDIREWAKGNLKSIDRAAGQWTFLIEYLSQIIVNQVLGK